MTASSGSPATGGVREEGPFPQVARVASDRDTSACTRVWLKFRNHNHSAPNKERIREGATAGPQRYFERYAGQKKGASRCHHLAAKGERGTTPSKISAPRHAKPSAMSAGIDHGPFYKRSATPPNHADLASLLVQSASAAKRHVHGQKISQRA